MSTAISCWVEEQERILLLDIGEGAQCQIVAVGDTQGILHNNGIYIEDSIRWRLIPLGLFLITTHNNSPLLAPCPNLNLPPLPNQGLQTQPTRRAHVQQKHPPLLIETHQKELTTTDNEDIDTNAKRRISITLQGFENQPEGIYQVERLPGIGAEVSRLY